MNADKVIIVSGAAANGLPKVINVTAGNAAKVVDVTASAPTNARKVQLVTSGNAEKVTGAAAAFDAASLAIFAAFTTPPTGARKTLINACVVSLKSAGVWAKLDVMYLFAAADSQAALINWVKPGTNNGGLVNAPVFTADRGFTGAATKYISTGFNPTTAPSPKLVQDSATLFAWSVNNPVGADGIISNSTGNLIIVPKYSSSGVRYVALNDTWTTPVVGNGQGLTAGSRVSAGGGHAVYFNGVAAESVVSASAAMANQSIVLLSGNGNVFADVCAGGGFGAGLTGPENLALFNALRAYMTGVGVP